MITAKYHIGFDAFYTTDDCINYKRVKLGPRQKSICQFAFKYPGLHSYNPKEASRINRLAELGLIKVHSESGQFQCNGNSI